MPEVFSTGELVVIDVDGDRVFLTPDEAYRLAQRLTIAAHAAENA